MTMAADHTTFSSNPGWLRDARFDGALMFAPLLLGLAGGLVSVGFPALFMPVVLLNLWVLGYHHAISTYTRMMFDRAGYEQSKVLIYGLIPVIAVIAIAVAHFFGIWALTTLYFYAQWFHYARQSWGISRAYERKAPGAVLADRSLLTQGAFYLFPIWGVLNRSYQSPDQFLGMAFKTIPVSEPVLTAVGVVSVALFAVWLGRMFVAWRRGALSMPYFVFMLSHFALFYVAYMVMPSLDTGWVMASIWHNLQYIMFVWLYNNNKYGRTPNPHARFLSFISRRENMWLYFGLCLMIATGLFGVVRATMDQMFGLAGIVIAYQIINFHHYAVDAIIWRAAWMRRAPQPAPVSAPAAGP